VVDMVNIVIIIRIWLKGFGPVRPPTEKRPKTKTERSEFCFFKGEA
jgi:hypothetical protein